MPDEYLPPNKIFFLQNLLESVTGDQLNALFSQLRIPILFFPPLICLYVCFLYEHRYPNLHEVRFILTKKDIAFVEYMDEVSATVAKEPEVCTISS